MISDIFRLFRLDGLDPLLRDLALIRILEPASKLASITLLTELFGKTHKRASLYRALPAFIQGKKTIEQKMIMIARNNFDFDFSIVFYDVTTLYFETFKEDEEKFRKPEFSKDNKPNQPQIVIGLIVTRDGFPVSYDVFEGSTFKGKTFIPIISTFRKRYDIETLTVVADAAMISIDNIEKLKELNLSYIVGARTANLKCYQIEQIHQELTGGSLEEEHLKKRRNINAYRNRERSVNL